MTLSDIAIRRPVVTTMVSAALMVLGCLGYSRLGVDLYPPFTLPFCVVETVYPGASPHDVESDVTRPLEDAVAGLSGLERLSSQSRDQVSLVMVQFKISVPLSEAVQQVRDKVAWVHLPQGAHLPVVSQFDINAQPVVVFAASSNQDVLKLTDILEEDVRPRLEQIEGVAAARILGQPQRTVAVDLWPDKLQALQLAPQQILNRIRAEHRNVPAGHLTLGPSEMNIRVRGEAESLEAFKRMGVARGADASTLRLQDVAQIKVIVEEPRTYVRIQGQPAVAVEVIKQAGANSVAVAQAVRHQLDLLQKQFSGAFRAQMVIDQSVTIQANAHEVWVAIYAGGAMAILIIWLFLLDWRGTLISALALPTSVVGTLFFMWLMGFTLNQLTLLGLSLAIGLLIDDAVVVRESITRSLEAGHHPFEAARQGTQAIALAVFATTLSLCAVFVPVAFMEGIVGQFFRQFGLTMAGAVLTSLWIALTLDPMLSARWVRPRGLDPQKAQGAGSHWYQRGVQKLSRGFVAVEHGYAQSLGWVLNHRLGVLGGALILWLGSLGLGSRLGVDFLGQEDRNQVVVQLEFPVDTRLETTSQRSALAEAQALELPGVSNVYAVLGPRQEAHKATWRVLLQDKKDRSYGIGFYKDRLRALAQRVPQARVSLADPPILEGLGDWPPIWMQVVGPDRHVLSQEAAFVAESLRAIEGTTDVHVQEAPGKPELHINVDHEAAARLDLPVASIAAQVRLALEGEQAGSLASSLEGGIGRRRVDIRVRLAEEGRTLEALHRMWIWGPQGPVGLSQVAQVVGAEGPAVIEHEMRQRQIGIVSQLSPQANLGHVTRLLQAKLSAHRLPEGYRYLWNGQQKDMSSMIKSFGMAMGLALIFIFMVLASQFESFIHPFTIMLSLPLALVGALGALAFTGSSLAMSAIIGLILLMGLVTKNAILLVDGALQFMRAGDTPLDAIRRAGPRRLRPIVMTSAAMVLGMLPTALGRGTGAEFRSPMAVAVIGGVITSTLLTLWVIPVVFVLMETLRSRLKRPRRDVT